MCQRLYRSHAHKCRKFEVDLATLSAVGRKVAPEQGIVLSVEGLYVLKPARARRLLCKHAM